MGEQTTNNLKAQFIFTKEYRLLKIAVEQLAQQKEYKSNQPPSSVSQKPLSASTTV